MLPIKSDKPRKICPIFKKRWNTPKTSSDLNENDIIRFSIPEKPTEKVSSSSAQKCVIFHSVPEERSRMCVYLLLFFVFFRGDRIEPVIAENQEWAHFDQNWKNFLFNVFIFKTFKTFSSLKISLIQLSRS
jgi:hypothetical protein